MDRGWRWVVATAAALRLTAGTGSAVAAQAGGESFELGIAKFTCETDPCPLGFGFDLPADCEATSEVSFEPANTDGEVIDTYRIQAGSGGYTLLVLYGISMTVTEDEDTIPRLCCARKPDHHRNTGRAGGG